MMEKQAEAHAPDSISSVGVQMKEYPPSEVFSSEPPPAYQRPRATAVQIARIAALTLVAVSFILGSFMLASAYVTATATCYTDYPQPPPQQQENVLEERPQFAGLVRGPNEEGAERGGEEEGGETRQEREGLLGAAGAQGPSDQIAEQQSRNEEPIQFRLPLQLDFDELAGSLMERNQRSRMNCVVEKRRAEEVTDHQPKTVKLPFGVNITSDPRYEHVTGERMAIFCESGADQRQAPMEQQIQQIVVPIPVHQMPMHPNAIPHEMKMEMRPNMFPMPQQHHQMMPPQFRPEFQQHMPQQQRARMMPPQFEGMMPPQQQQQPQWQQGGVMMPPHHPPQQQFAERPIPPQERHHMMMLMSQQPQQVQLPPQFAPHQIAVQQAIQAIEQEEALQQQQNQSPEEHHQVIIQEEEMVPLMRFGGGAELSSDVPSDTVRPPPPPFHRLPQQGGQPQPQQQQHHHQQQTIMMVAQEGEPQQPTHLPLRELPIRPDVAGPMAAGAGPMAPGAGPYGSQAQQQPTPLQLQQVDQPVAVPQQDSRPHFVQPRSVRSVESVLHPRNKRVRRCACDCAC